MIVRVFPGNLRLPPSRRGGADPVKLFDQIRQFGDRTDGMPRPQVTRGMKSELMINDGVTRASRVAKLRPEATIEVEVIEERLQWSLDHLPRVRDSL